MENKAFCNMKIWIWYIGKVWIFQKGYPLILGKIFFTKIYILYFRVS